MVQQLFRVRRSRLLPVASDFDETDAVTNDKGFSHKSHFQARMAGVGKK
jgi:hypothetical protein